MVPGVFWHVIEGMTAKLTVGIIGTGNIGMDLLKKVIDSSFLECSLFMGRNEASKGLAAARTLGIPTTHESIAALERDPSQCDIVFDATSAKAHLMHAPILKALGKFAIDLTPSDIGMMCVPAINLDTVFKSDNVGLITCGAQATIPIAKALVDVCPASYIEVVSSVSSKSAGPGTRANLHEYLRRTSDALKTFTGVPATKAILIINPAEPEIVMQSTIYLRPEREPDMAALKRAAKTTAAVMQSYVPGYELVIEPSYDGRRVTTMVRVTGRGDYLPTYAGNLDIITSAAVQVAEAYARLPR